MLTVTGDDFGPVQVVNLCNPLGGGHSGLGLEVLRDAAAGVVQGSSLRVVSLHHLVALKLFVGGRAALTDVMEVLERNRPVDVEKLRAVCHRFGLADQLKAVLTELEL